MSTPQLTIHFDGDCPFCAAQAGTPRHGDERGSRKEPCHDR